MPLIYNGVTVTDIIYKENGLSTTLDKLIYNGVEVFTKTALNLTLQFVQGTTGAQGPWIDAAAVYLIPDFSNVNNTRYSFSTTPTYSTFMGTGYGAGIRLFSGKLQFVQGTTGTQGTWIDAAAIYLIPDTSNVNNTRYNLSITPTYSTFMGTGYGAGIRSIIAIIREPATGEHFLPFDTQWMDSASLPQSFIFWGSSTILVGGFSSSLSSYSYNGYTYYKGSDYGANVLLGTHDYGIYRIKN